MLESYDGRLVVFGCGAVASCFLDMLAGPVGWDPRRLLLVEREDKECGFRHLVERGAGFRRAEITPENIDALVRELCEPGDFVVDLTVNVDTVAFLRSCQDRGVFYLNAALEQWTDGPGEPGFTAGMTLYDRHRTLARAGFSPDGPSALLDSGANPGLVSHFVKAALWDLAGRKGLDRDGLGFPELARALGVESIHISEWDTQEGDFRREPGEFQNTWSVAGLMEEARAPAEMGWGTHEGRFPADGMRHDGGPGNQIFLERAGCMTAVRSWVPSGPIEGYVIRHGEAYTLSCFLTLEREGRVVYRPTVHYAYKPCRATRESMAEWIAGGFAAPSRQTLLLAQPDRGRDELGVLLMGEELGAWWYGSLLGIEEARKLMPGHNATTVQVAAGMLAGLDAVLREPRRGVMVPEDIDYVRALEVARPFLGPLVFLESDWRPEKPRGHAGSRWQFENLRIS